MKQVRNKIRSILLGLNLLAATGCEKQEEPAPAVPYYQFTADDRQWLTPKIGDTWVLETATGKQQRYQVESKAESLRNSYTQPGYGLSLSSPPTLYYYDRAYIEIKRLDSLQYNTLYFRRSLPTSASWDNPPQGNGELTLSGHWWNYNGNTTTELGGNLNPAPDLLQHRITMTVNGRLYTDVMIMNANQPPRTSPEKTYINTMYYAQREGVIRMVSSTGETWNRVP